MTFSVILLSSLADFPRRPLRGGADRACDAGGLLAFELRCDTLGSPAGCLMDADKARTGLIAATVIGHAATRTADFRSE